MNEKIPTLRLDKRKVQIAMINSGMTTMDVASRLSVTRQTVHNAMSGRNTTLDTVSKIAAALGVDPVSILTVEAHA